MTRDEGDPRPWTIDELRRDLSLWSAEELRVEVRRLRWLLRRCRTPLNQWLHEYSRDMGDEQTLMAIDELPDDS